MYKGKRILGLIPARGGSQGVPRKNIRDFNGKPMIAHSIEKALAVPELDRLAVSTDDPEIAEVAKEYGAEAPFLRSAELARSTTPMVPVIVDAVARLQTPEVRFDYALMLQANSPLTRTDDIKRVLSKLIDEELDVVFTVSEISHPPQWALKIENSTPVFAFPERLGEVGNCRQDQEVLYRSTGAVYGVRLDYLLKDSSGVKLALPAPGQRTGAVVTDFHSSIDIDTDLDFHVADAIFKMNSEDSRRK